MRKNIHHPFDIDNNRILFVLLSAPQVPESPTLLPPTAKSWGSNTLTVTQTAGGSTATAIPLDSGATTIADTGNGAEVGSWSVKGNSSGDLILTVVYDTFKATIGDVEYSIPYILYNDAAEVLSGQEFATLIRTGRSLC